MAERAGGVLSGRMLALGLAASLATTALLFRHEGETLAWSLAVAIPYGMAGAIAAAIRWFWREPDTEGQRIARDAAEYIGLFVTICLLGALASYPEAAASRGFVDPSLERIDRALHFDWVGWYRVIADHPALQVLGRLAYASIFVTPAVLLGHFAIVDRKGDARRFLTAFWMAAALTLALFPSLTAIGPLATLWHGRIPYMPTSALFQMQIIPELRSHAVTAIDPGALQGLVCAPSFHTASAVLYIAAAWPIARLRWPVLAVNAAMLLATPVEGTHYLADMIGGALVAVAALAGAALLCDTAWPARRVAGRARVQ